MSDESRKYFEQRAAEERKAANLADDHRAADSHRELARRYKKLAESGEERQQAETAGLSGDA